MILVATNSFFKLIHIYIVLMILVSILSTLQVKMMVIYQNTKIKTELINIT